jgi:hypothetical protein
MAGDAITIGIEGLIKPRGQSLQASSEDYWNRYPDVANDSLYGRSNPDGARRHYDLYGRAEGRVWNDLPGDIGIFTRSKLTNQSNPNVNGVNSFTLPNGGKIGGFSWQSTVKVLNSEVLAILVLSNPHPAIKHLIRIHHLGQGTVPRDVLLPDPIDALPGAEIWAYAEGWGDEQRAGFEIQTTVYTIGQPAVVFPT